jgi:hypothetical protein
MNEKTIKKKMKKGEKNESNFVVFFIHFHFKFEILNSKKKEGLFHFFY